MSARQLSLDLDVRGPSPHDGEAPAIDETFTSARRIDFGRDAWIDHVPAWVRGARALFVALERAMRWKGEKRLMYERVVDVPRLLAVVPDDGPGHPLLACMSELLSARYEAPLHSILLALYRDGRDSVAWHRDRGHRDRERSVVAVASLGGTRRFLVRPLGGGRTSELVIRSGDLVVMGGACQRVLEHCIPKVPHAEPRMALMFRHREPISVRVLP